MARKSEEPQPDLFDDKRPIVAMKPSQTKELAAALELLLAEIASALAGAKSRENGHE